LKRASRSGGIGPPEIEEDFERCGTRLIEELEAACCHTVHVTRLLHSERSGQLLTADVHVKRVGLHVEELASRAETAELPSTSIVDAPFATSTRTKPNASKL
jgi:hypothetical protein